MHEERRKYKHVLFQRPKVKEIIKKINKNKESSA